MEREEVDGEVDEEVDVVVVGGGAGGIGAARKLTQSGLKTIILEAQQRIGGRIYTNNEISSLLGYPLEWGAEFIHGENTESFYSSIEANLKLIFVPRYEKLRWGSDDGKKMNLLREIEENSVWVRIVNQFYDLSNFNLQILKTSPQTMRNKKKNSSDNNEEEKEEFNCKEKEISEKEIKKKYLEEKEKEDNEETQQKTSENESSNYYYYSEELFNENDMSVEEYLKRTTDPWGDLENKIAEILIAQTSCSSLSQMSAEDFQLEMKRDKAGSQEYRMGEGYSSLLSYWTNELNIVYGAQVNKVKWRQIDQSSNNQSKYPICVTTKDGRRWRASQCVIAVPVSILQSNFISFEPDLPIIKKGAISRFRTEAATKIVLIFDRILWENNDDITMFGHFGKTPRWWTPAFGRTPINDHVPFICYATSSFAEYLDQLSEDECFDQALNDLCILLGIDKSIAEKHVVRRYRFSWSKNPFSLGGYANTKIGYANDRFLLSEPIESLLFFAGEAAAINSNPQTVHGAYSSGLLAASQLLSSSNI